MAADTPAPTSDPPPSSALARLRAQRSRLADQTAEFHVHVPRTDDPAIYVVYRATHPGAVQEAVERRTSKAKGPEAKRNAVVLANADVLVEHCVGIYEVTADGKEVGLDPDAPDAWPRYGPRLAELLGVEAPTPVAACIALFATPADLVTHAGQLAQLSGFDVSAAEERFRGE